MNADTIITKKIIKQDPSIRLQDCDRKLLQVACEDFENYIKHVWNPNSNLDVEQKLEELSMHESQELDAFLTIWTCRWMQKWKQRIKLLIGKQNKSQISQLSKTLVKAQSQWTVLEHKGELIDIVTSALTRNGEICATKLLAEYILKTELAKDKVEFSNKQQALTFLSNVIHKAAEISQSSGPLIFIEVNKAYYELTNNQQQPVE